MKDGEENLYATWAEFDHAVETIQQQVNADELDYVCGIARGGLPLAVSLSHALDVPMATIEATRFEQEEEFVAVVENAPLLNTASTVLLVDDIVDTGTTLKTVLEQLADQEVFCIAASWHVKPDAEIEPDIHVEEIEKWAVYPWENSK